MGQEPYARGFDSKRPRALYIGVPTPVNADDTEWTRWAVSKDNYRIGSWNVDGLSTGQGQELKDKEGTVYTCLSEIWPTSAITTLFAGYDIDLKAICGSYVEYSGRKIGGLFGTIYHQVNDPKAKNIKTSPILTLAAGETITRIETKAAVPPNEEPKASAGSKDSKPPEHDRMHLLGLKLTTSKGTVWKAHESYDKIVKTASLNVVSEEAPQGWHLKGFYGSSSPKAILRLGPVWGIML